MDITVRYNLFSGDEDGEQEMSMEVSDGQYEKLEAFEEDGELLNEEFISLEMPGLHKKIMKTIHQDIEDREYDSHIETRPEQSSLPWITSTKEVVVDEIPSDFPLATDEELVYEIDL